MDGQFAGIRTRYALGLGRSRRLIAVESIEAASAVYCRIRDESNLGMSDLPEGMVYELGKDSPKRVAIVSYNGRVWDVVEYRAEQRRVYESLGSGGALGDGRALGNGGAR